ncbi:MAG: CPBP family intramembrane metalloprotease [Clostridia bacterium]|nr:CPBP family intramembrane metalloprotease [Clostridia bacterium]
MAKNNQTIQTNANKKGFLNSFKKSTPKLEFYDASAMFIAQFILQYMLQLVMMILAISILTYKLGADMSTQEGSETVQNAFSVFTASTGGIILVTLLNESTMILSPLCYWKIKSFNVFKGMGFKRKISGGQIALTLPIAIGLLAGFMPLASMFVYLVNLTGYHYSGANIVVDSFGKLVLYLIFVAAIPAVCEEIMHRGIIARCGSRISIFAGIILSSTIFAFMHGSPMQLVHQFFVGVVCCLVYYMTGSIWANVLVHFFNNAITLISSYVIYLITGSTDLSIPWWGLLILCIGGLAILVGCFIAMYKMSYAKRQKEDKEMGVEQEQEVIYTGKKQPIKIFNKKLAYLFKSPEEALEEKRQAEELEKQLSDYSEEKKEVYASLRQEDDVTLKKKNSRGIIFALVVVLVIWIINTIGGYTS